MRFVNHVFVLLYLTYCLVAVIYSITDIVGISVLYNSMI